MKKVLILSFITCTAMTMYAQQGTVVQAPVQTTDTKAQATQPQKPADLTLSVKEEIFDFGKIPQGKPVHHVFIVTNTGTQPLKIANVQASCGCTTPEWDKEGTIDPGKEGKITVGYNAAAEGPFTKFITVTYNETGSRQITIKGEVWKTPAVSAPENKGLNDLKNK